MYSLADKVIKNLLNDKTFYQHAVEQLEREHAVDACSAFF